MRSLEMFALSTTRFGICFFKEILRNPTLLNCSKPLGERHHRIHKTMVEISHWEPNPDEFALVRTELFSVLEARPLDLRHIANYKVSCKGCFWHVRIHYYLVWFFFVLFRFNFYDISLCFSGSGTVSYTHLTLPTICSV